MNPGLDAANVGVFYHHYYQKSVLMLKKLLIVPSGGNPRSASSQESNPLIVGPRTVCPPASANPFFKHHADKQINRWEGKHKAQSASKFVGRVEKSKLKCPNFPKK